MSDKTTMTTCPSSLSAIVNLPAPRSLFPHRKLRPVVYLWEKKRKKTEKTKTKKENIFVIFKVTSEDKLLKCFFTEF